MMETMYTCRYTDRHSLEQFEIYIISGFIHYLAESTLDFHNQYVIK